MTKLYLHEHPNFVDLIRIVSDEKSIDPSLVEKDYWIMHCLYGLKFLGLKFRLKGGTSLSKAFGIIHRFSEDIDLWIEPPAELNVKTGKNHNKPAHVESRLSFYNWLAENIRISGIIEVRRDTDFDDTNKYRSGGIRLHYKSATTKLEGVKEGILLETGFDTVSPSEPITITSWAYEHAVSSGVELTDNRAVDIECYHPGYTFVEKLQAISTKYRRHREGHALPPNFMRHYYDIYCLLDNQQVQDFIGTDEYKEHKNARFPTADNKNIAENPAFNITKPEDKVALEATYKKSGALYYNDQPSFDVILEKIAKNIRNL